MTSGNIAWAFICATIILIVAYIATKSMVFVAVVWYALGIIYVSYDWYKYWKYVKEEIKEEPFVMFLGATITPIFWPLAMIFDNSGLY